MSDFNDYKIGAPEGSDPNDVTPNQSQEEMLLMLRQQAESGDILAQNALASFYLLGKGGVEQDEAEAFRWFKRAAAQGDANAQAMLGQCYDSGWGVEKSDWQAVYWYRKAAQQDQPQALFNLGIHSITGDGCKVDMEAGFRFFQRAAELGHAGAQCRIGICYENGFGVEKNQAKAIEAYEKAIQMGDTKAAGHLEELRKEMREARERQERQEKRDRERKAKAAKRKMLMALVTIAVAVLTVVAFHFARGFYLRDDTLTTAFVGLPAALVGAIIYGVTANGLFNKLEFLFAAVLFFPSVMLLQSDPGRGRSPELIFLALMAVAVLCQIGLILKAARQLKS